MGTVQAQSAPTTGSETRCTGTGADSDAGRKRGTGRKNSASRSMPSLPPWKKPKFISSWSPNVTAGLSLIWILFLRSGWPLGEGDASTAWVSNFYIEHNWILSQFPEAFQKELFANRSYILAPAMVALGGNAVPEDGGYRINGRWQWASGIMHGDWVIPAALELTTDGKPNPRWFALPVC